MCYLWYKWLKKNITFDKLSFLSLYSSYCLSNMTLYKGYCYSFSQLKVSKVDYLDCRCDNTYQEIRIIINKQLLLTNSNLYLKFQEVFYLCL